MADSEMHRAQPAAAGPQPNKVQTARAQKRRKRLRQISTGNATGEAPSGSDSDMELLAEMDGCQRAAPAETPVHQAHSAGAEDDGHAKAMLPEEGGCRRAAPAGIQVQRAAPAGIQAQQAPDAGTQGDGYALEDLEAAPMSDVNVQQEQSSGLQLLFPESAAHIRWDFSTSACCQMTKDTYKTCIRHDTEVEAHADHVSDQMLWMRCKIECPLLRGRRVGADSRVTILPPPPHLLEAMQTRQAAARGAQHAAAAAQHGSGGGTRRKGCTPWPWLTQLTQLMASSSPAGTRTDASPASETHGSSAPAAQSYESSMDSHPHVLVPSGPARLQTQHAPAPGGARVVQSLKTPEQRSRSPEDAAEAGDGSAPASAPLPAPSGSLPQKASKKPQKAPGKANGAPATAAPGLSLAERMRLAQAGQDPLSKAPALLPTNPALGNAGTASAALRNPPACSPQKAPGDSPMETAPARQGPPSVRWVSGEQPDLSQLPLKQRLAQHERNLLPACPAPSSPVNPSQLPLKQRLLGGEAFQGNRPATPTSAGRALHQHQPRPISREQAPEHYHHHHHQQQQQQQQQQQHLRFGHSRAAVNGLDAQAPEESLRHSDAPDQPGAQRLQARLAQREQRDGTPVRRQAPPKFAGDEPALSQEPLAKRLKREFWSPGDPETEEGGQATEKGELTPAQQSSPLPDHADRADDEQTFMDSAPEEHAGWDDFQEQMQTPYDAASLMALHSVPDSARSAAGQPASSELQRQRLRPQRDGLTKDSGLSPYSLQQRENAQQPDWEGSQAAPAAKSAAYVLATPAPAHASSAATAEASTELQWRRPLARRPQNFLDDSTPGMRTSLFFLPS